MSDNIPFEIQIEIMKRLPAKSLMQSRSVSKTWKSLIDSTQFIADYNECETRLQCMLTRQQDFEQNYVSIADDDNFPQHKFPTTGPMSFEILDSLNFVGSSQGLLCFQCDYPNPDPDAEFPDSINQKAVIWNPSLNKYIDVGVPMLYNEIHSCRLGFGVRPDTNDLVLVKINDTSYPWPVEVFTLSSSVWRSPRGSLPRKSIRFGDSQVAIDGFIYWHAVDVLNTDTGFRSFNMIISFDMTSEEFTQVNLPDCFACRQPLTTLSISKLRESVVVLQKYKEATGPIAYCDVWVMISKSFSKLFKIEAPAGTSLKRVVGFNKNGEAVVETTRDGSEELEVYEPRLQHVKSLGMNGLLFVSFYSETLLLHDRLEGEFINIEMVPYKV